VRVGDLSLFQKTLTTHDALFAADRTRSLILRLRHNVIKTGIRTISLAYSRISLHDITQKLHLESEEDAEYIVAKAVRDGVIEARVDHERGEMRSAETGDLYGTNEPQAQFRQRVNYCLQLHNESVKVRAGERRGCVRKGWATQVPWMTWPRPCCPVCTRADPPTPSRPCATRSTTTRPSSRRRWRRASASARLQTRLPTAT
jgi:hypothetical protein